MKSQLNKPLLLSLTVILTGVSVSSTAATLDARSHAMGGVGVSSANYVTASFHNPAMAAKHDERADFGLLAPTLGIQVDDPDELFNDATDFYDIFDNGTPAEIEAALTEMSGDKAYSEITLGAVVSVPTQHFSTNVYLQGYADSFIFSDVKSDDAAGSKLSVYAISVAEVGMTFAGKFDTRYGGIYAGVSPKYNVFSTYNYTQSITDFDPGKFEDGASTDETNINFDFGIAVDLINGFTAGAVIKNVMPYEIDLEPMNGSSASYSQNPIITAGLSWKSDYATFAVDIDANAAERYENVVSLTGVDDDFDDTQMLKLGGEIGSPDIMQFRAGFNKDLKGNKADVVTAGIGLSPFNIFHLDFAASYGGNNKFGVVAQTMVWF